MSRPRGRPKLGQSSLSRTVILATALRLIDTAGVEALSMRRLAAELGVDPMALYHYVPGKRALLQGVIALVFGELQVAVEAGAPWPNRVRSFARAYHGLIQAHPLLARHLAADADAGAEAALPANEALYAALADAGLSPRLTVLAADVIVDYLHGYALGAAAGDLDERATMLSRLSQYPAEQFPVLRRVYGKFNAGAFIGDWQAGLDLILAGLRALTE